MIVLQLTKKGFTTRYCDSLCHDSTHSDCECICQGLLHGKGEKYAQANKLRVALLLRWQAGNEHLSAYPVPSEPIINRQATSIVRSQENL